MASNRFHFCETKNNSTTSGYKKKYIQRYEVKAGLDFFLSQAIDSAHCHERQ